MNTTLRTILTRLQSDNYIFYYKDILCDNREELKDLLLNGLKLTDLRIRESDSSCILFDMNTCEFAECSGYYWLSNEELPDCIIWSEYEDACYHEDDVVLCYTNYRNQEYICANNEDIYEYRGNYYLYNCLSEHDLFEYDGDIYHHEDIVSCEDSGNNIPHNCAFYCEEEDCYYEDINNMTKTGLKGYHKSKIENKAKESRIKIGFEIEKEDSGFSNFTNIREIGWDAEKDGSLNSNGFELVSAIYDLEDLTQLKEDTEQIEDYLRADYSRNCGGHINVSIQDKSNREVFNLIRGFVPLIYAMYYGRLDNRFATAKKINELGGYNRYDAFNFTKNSGILEFRIFSAVRTKEQLIWRAEFMALMFKHHRKGSASVLKMLFTDSPIRKHLLKIYPLAKFDNLIDRVVKYTDIYMTVKDSNQTAKIIIDYKNKKNILIEAETIIKDAMELGRDMPTIFQDTDCIE
jgi:hypothetical protein